MSDTPKAIELLAGAAGAFIHSEAASAAASAIKPGMLVEELAAGTVQEQSTAAGAVVQVLIALVNLATGGGIDTAYAVGEVVRYGAAQRGQEAYMFLEDEGDVAIGAALEANGAGALQARTTGQVIAYALEAVDNTGGSGDVRIRVRIA